MPCAAAPSSARFSHTRASVHCRLTVAGETPTTSAVSSTVSPPKYRNSTMRARASSSSASLRSASSSASTSMSFVAVLIGRGEPGLNLVRRHAGVVERHARRRTAALERPPGARALDEDLPHRQRGDGEEVRASIEVPRALGRHAHERFVHESRGLKGLPGTLASDVAGGDAPQLVVDERHQFGWILRHLNSQLPTPNSQARRARNRDLPSCA